MSDMADFGFHIEDAYGIIRQAIDLGNDITHPEWKEMNDYLAKLDMALELLKMPTEIEQAVDATERLDYDLECRADALSY